MSWNVCKFRSCYLTLASSCFFFLLSDVAIAAAPAIPVYNVTVLGLHGPDTATASATPAGTTAVARPCLFIRASNNNYYAIPKTSLYFAELKQLTLTAYLLKSPVNIYVKNTGTSSQPVASGVCSDAGAPNGYPEVDAIALG
jgi:hypothetical protein